ICAGKQFHCISPLEVSSASRTHMGTVSSAAVCRCRPMPAPDAKPWHVARLGPALSSETLLNGNKNQLFPCTAVCRAGALARLSG
ncbi:hypothetical protein, partial [Halomonas sp.]|uniref:hypothetical protein n=1 Tax=Halomonas sp. TaxID=1486246 RepID=UPI003F9CC0F2